MDTEIVPVISLIGNLELTERHITNGGVKEAVGQVCLFIALHGDIVLLIQLLSDSAGYAVKLHAVYPRFAHAVGNQSHEVADTAGRLQNVAVLEAHVFQRFIDHLDNDRRRIESCQGRFTGRFQLIIRQYSPKLVIVGMIFIEEIRKTAPTDIVSENPLFIGLRQPMFVLQFMKELDRHNIMVESFKRRTDADVIIFDNIVRSVVGFDFRIQNMRR